jgi:hypothetical protein
MNNEDEGMERICVSQSIDGCLVATYYDKNDTVYVHTCNPNLNKVICPTIEQVEDSPFTGEQWIIEPVEMKLFMTLKITERIPRKVEGTKLFPVTSALSFGRLITKVDVVYNKAAQAIESITANNEIVTRTVPKDPTETALIDKYKALSDPLANRVIGSITADITRTANAAGESALGDVIADAQLAATAPNGFGNAAMSRP